MDELREAAQGFDPAEVMGWVTLAYVVGFIVILVLTRKQRNNRS